MTVSLAVPDVLVARAQAGDEGALEALYRAFETPVYNLARRMLRRPEDAEDVLQETFLEVVRNIKQYRGEGHLWGWVRRIASTKALMRIRRDQLRATESLDDEPGGRAMHVGANLDLERAFEVLSETSRAVVWLHDVEGYTHEEIAEQMGRSVSFSKSQLARAHARLRRMRNDGGGGATPACTARWMTWEGGCVVRGRCGHAGTASLAPSVRRNWKRCTSGWRRSRHCRRWDRDVIAGRPSAR